VKSLFVRLNKCLASVLLSICIIKQNETNDMPPLSQLLASQHLCTSAIHLDRNDDIKILFGLMLGAIFLIWVYPTELDLKLSNLYFDKAANSFTLKHQYFLDVVMHDMLKQCMRIIALGSLLLALLATIKQQAGQSIIVFIKTLFSHPLFFVFVGMFAANSAVGILKHLSVHGCPSNLLIYGGKLPLLQLFSELPFGVNAGHCFPGAHASGGFALVSFYFAFKNSKPKFAGAMLVISLVLGFTMGWVQIMRGEHFLSHNLWSAWVVWLVVFVLFSIKKVIEKK
jgi:membrane-associated PAP2 superfamily phosphatase